MTPRGVLKRKPETGNSMIYLDPGLRRGDEQRFFQRCLVIGSVYIVKNAEY